MPFMSIFQKDDPDPTPNDGRPCGRERNGFVCTWPAGHPIRWHHVAGNGKQIVEVWADAS